MGELLLLQSNYQNMELLHSSVPATYKILITSHFTVFLEHGHGQLDFFKTSDSVSDYFFIKTLEFSDFRDLFVLLYAA